MTTKKSEPPLVHFCTDAYPASVFAGRRVALVGSGPSAIANPPERVDSFDVVVRVNNYKLIEGTGRRTDVHYSYFGGAIRKSRADLVDDGVRLCMCKCPNGQFIESDWHRTRGKMAGVDFRWIYEARADWWFCPTWVPTVEAFLEKFALLERHIPTTGFAALLDVLSFDPKAVYMTGFDFFTTGVHNLNERWRRANPDDPIGHSPERERAWLRANLRSLPIEPDAALAALLR